MDIYEFELDLGDGNTQAIAIEATDRESARQALAEAYSQYHILPDPEPETEGTNS